MRNVERWEQSIRIRLISPCVRAAGMRKGVDEASPQRQAVRLRRSMWPVRARVGPGAPPFRRHKIAGAPPGFPRAKPKGGFRRVGIKIADTDAFQCQKPFIHLHRTRFRLSIQRPEASLRGTAPYIKLRGFAAPRFRHEALLVPRAMTKRASLR